MYVCICRAVTDRQIDAAIGGGARTVEGIGRATGAGTDCGQCRRAIAHRLGAGQGSGGVGAPTLVGFAESSGAREERLGRRGPGELDLDPPRLA